MLTPDTLLPICSNKMNIWVEPVSKIYTDNTGHFPIRDRRGNQYILTAYHCESNTILVEPLNNKKSKDRIAAYNSMIHRLTSQGYKFNFQILNNNVRDKHKPVTKEDYNITYQPLTPYTKFTTQIWKR